MLGVSVLEMSVIYGVIINVSVPVSNIKKKHHAFAYHFIKEAGAAGLVCIIYKPSKQNQADALTKTLPPHLLYNLMKTLIFNKDYDFQHRIKRNIKTSMMTYEEVLTGANSSHANWLYLHIL